MVDFEVGEFTARRRFDAAAAATVVLTVDAALFLVVAVVGVPFLLFVFGDDDTGTWPHMAPLLTWWVAAALLGAACATAVVRSFRRGGTGAGRIGVVSAIATVVAVGVLIAVSVERAPLLAAVGALLAIANGGAALALTRPGEADPAAEGPEIVFMEDADAFLEDEVFTGGEVFTEDAGEEAEPRITVELARTGPGRAIPSAARRRLRRQAAMRTHAGVRLGRRPRR
ncbi:hypothetical protein [Actinoplanes subtropicus]|uniref:hypothetical protein n=1 Tax=Actinoplanes subtropicus TaxID=543632 RepID=UPI0004C47221|nr:hypothetical protein [Actinoplanes subtropicus]